MSPSASCSLPPARMVPGNRSGAGSPFPFGLAVYLALQPMRCTADRVATITGGLLPRLFTLIPTRGRDGYFLLHDCELSPAFPLGNMAPYVARTFLPVCTGRQNGLRRAKIDVLWDNYSRKGETGRGGERASGYFGLFVKIVYIYRRTFITSNLIMRLKSHKDLIVFKSAIKLAIRIHELSKNFPPEEKYSLTDKKKFQICCCQYCGSI